MPTAKPWRFRQLGGPKKTLELRGWAAPFGRPRQKAVARKPQSVRQERVYYLGNPRPTRHLFGMKYDDMVLNGRWMDLDLGVNGAKAKVREIEEFIADQQPIVIEWGDMVGAVGLMQEFDPGFESEDQVEWKLTFGIDVNNLSVRRPPTVTPNATARALFIKIPNDALPLLTAPSFLDTLEGLSEELLDSIDDQLSLFTGAMGQFARAAADISSLEAASEAQLKRLVYGIGQAATAAQTLLDLYDSIDKEDVSSLTSTRETTTLDFARWRVEQDLAFNALLAQLAELDAQAELAARGAAQGTYDVQAGDTWESIALKLYGDVNQAGTLRAANGAQYGSQPAPGPIIVPAQK